MVGRGDPFFLKFWVKLTLFERNRRFSVDIRSYSVSAVTPRTGSVYRVQAVLKKALHDNAFSNTAREHG